MTDPILRGLTPSCRRALLAIGAIWIAVGTILRPLNQMVRAPSWTEALPHVISQILVVVLLFGFLLLCYRLALNFSSLPPLVRRNPQICLHTVFWVLLMVIWVTPAETGLWRIVLVGFATMLPLLPWRVGYLLLSGQPGKAAGTRFRDHLIYFWPFYEGSNIPYGKGLEYLSRHEAKEEGSFAVAQLAGLRLLILAGIWHVSELIMNGVVFGVDNAVRQAAGNFTFESLTVPEGGSSNWDG